MEKLIAGKTINVNEEGYLTDFSQWDKSIAEEIAKEEGEEFSEKMVIRGTLERMIPVLMTAVPSILAVIPLVLSKGEPGKEILYPVGVVIIGGVLSSTLLDLVVTPTIFYHFGKKSSLKWLHHENNKHLNKELI